MSTLKLTRVIALALAGSLAASVTTAAVAKPHQERGSQTYLSGEGGCKEDMGYWSHPCSD
jgi:hypothetical protein